MDITTLSKSELIELLYAVTEKAKKKDGKKGIQTPPALPLEDNSSKPLKGKHWSQWKSPRLAENQMKRRKELFEATEKAKKRADSNPMGGDGSNSKYYDGPNNRFRLNPDATPYRVPSAGQTTPRVMPGSRVDINKQNKDAAANQKKATLNKRSDFHKMKVNEAKMKRRKELDSSSVTEKGRGGGAGGPKETGNEPRPSKSYSREAMNRPKGPGNKYSAPQGPDKKSRSMKKSWEWESPMGKMRGKELQTEQAIDQYLSYESEMDDNRQLMFEVITEKTHKPGHTPPRQAGAQAAAAGRQSLAESNKRQAQTEQSRRDRVRQGVEKYSQEDAERSISAGHKRRLNEHDYVGTKPVIRAMKLLPGLSNLANDIRAEKKVMADRPTHSLSWSNPKASKVSKMSGAEVYRASKVDTDAKRRRKELQFDGSLVVGAESFFLQMVAATKPK